MAYGLVKCACRHIQPLEYTARIISSNYYHNKIDAVKYQCVTCLNTDMYLITNYDPSFVYEKFVVGTFGAINYRDANELLSMKNDSIRNVLASEKFSVSKETTRELIVYESPEGFKALFFIRGHLVTQELILIAPAKHPIFKKVVEANRADKRVKKLATPPKTPLPTKQHDFLGEEITVGDWVAYSSMSYTNLRCGKITKINEKSVTLKDKQGTIVKGKQLTQVIKISKERSVLLMLEM